MGETSRLGILDWGIGGISIYKLIKQRTPGVGVTYFSDTGATPYGKMARSELIARLNSVIGELKNRGVDRLVIGCNAASTALGEIDPQGLQIEGVIETAVESAAKAEPKTLGLIGGRRTVVSGVYRRAFAALGIDVRQRVAQPLSGLIEAGDVSSEKLREACFQILRPIAGCSHILLACTHYPAIAPVLREFVSAETAFIDPAAGLAVRVGKWRLAAGDDAFLTTGDPRAMTVAARNAFGVAIDRARRVAV